MTSADLKRAALMAAAALGAIALVAWNLALHQHSQELSATIEALGGQLSDERAEVQRFNAELGLAQSVVASRDQMIAQYRSEIDSLNLSLRSVKGAARLRPVGRDQAVVPLSGHTEGGSQTTAGDPQAPGAVVSYTWSDTTGRFRLQDPDIAISGNEQFSYSTKLRVTGYLLSDASGKVQARQVVAQEQYTVDGKTQLGPPIPLEQNIMEYVPEAQKAKVPLDILRPRAFVMATTGAKIGVGVEVLNLGHYIEYANVGVAANISTSGTSLPAVAQNAEIGLMATYWGLPPLISTNIAVGLGITTPAATPGQQVGVTGNVLFYLNN